MQKKLILFLFFLLIMLPIVYFAVTHPISGQKIEEINLIETQVEERITGAI